MGVGMEDLKVRWFYVGFVLCLAIFNLFEQILQIKAILYSVVLTFKFLHCFSSKIELLVC